ncbi:diaminopimelate decarboxylase [Streptomyces badius]
MWSRTVTRDADGALTVGGIAVARLAEEFGTPAYFLDESDFRARCRAWADAFGPDADVYAGKAFPSVPSCAG